ncbi:DUF6660 family protein [Flavobacterium kayseriense]|uniref:DUF6660 family protein n=1 Tax=Flavobacterium kayseriense TaxID=2764714 RepID=UPI001C9BB1F5|nr:DUF6660 family protein [Flavobacterium kayseriense]
MKIMVTLLSFFILTFSIAPNLFTTNDDCDTEKIIGDHKDSNCDADCDSKCSPFYSCGNCLCFPIQLQVQTTNFRSKIVSKCKSQNYYYQFDGSSSFNDTIWQPPQ